MKKFGKYLLERQLAIGGMAEIFLARQHGPAGFEKTLVIKRILPTFANDEQFITMFLDEARTSAKLNHPNLVQIYELGEIEGAYYIAMEFIRGESLNKIIKKLQALKVHMPLHLAAKIVASVCAGLDYAHNFTTANGESLNLVHRDISPDNVLVSYAGAVKMIDFGIAKARTSEAKTQAGAVKGKFCYMSPEQITGKTLDRRSDIFSLGIVLHELTTLTKPFGDGADLMTVSAIVNDPPRAAADYIEEYPAPLWDIINRALTKSPKKRFQSAHEMQIALERFIHSRGEFLSDRDIGAYIRKLFSGKDEDINDLREMASGIRSRVMLPPTVALEPPSEASLEKTQLAELTDATTMSESPSEEELDDRTIVSETLNSDDTIVTVTDDTEPADTKKKKHARTAITGKPKGEGDPAQEEQEKKGGAMKWVLLLLLLIALGVGGWYGYSRYAAGSGDSKKTGSESAANTSAAGSEASDAAGTGQDGTDGTGTQATDGTANSGSGGDGTGGDGTGGDGTGGDGTGGTGGTGGTDGTSPATDAPDAGSTAEADAGTPPEADAGAAAPDATEADVAVVIAGTDAGAPATDAGEQSQTETTAPGQDVGPAVGTDALDTDAGTAATTDAGIAATIDSGAAPDADAGTAPDPDAAMPADAGTPAGPDAGEAKDAGTAASADAGTAPEPDVGATTDTGAAPEPDVGATTDTKTATTPDAGTTADAGSLPDTGPAAATDTGAATAPDAGTAETPDVGTEAPDTGTATTPDVGAPVPDVGPVPKKRATLSIRARGKGKHTVKINGVRRGKAPLTVTLKPGRYSVQVLGPAGLKKTYNVGLKPGQVRRITVEAPKGTGTLVFALPAGTRVKLNGRYIGKAPLKSRKVTYGLHTVVLKNPSGQTARKRIRVGPTRTRVTISQ